MTNNDILRRLRYLFDWSDGRVLELARFGGSGAGPEDVRSWLRREEEAGFSRCGDRELSAVLDGLIAERRGPRDGAVPGGPGSGVTLTNNLVLRKLKIALNLQETDMLELLAEAGLPLSRPELSALFRRADHRHYRECQDQILRNFLRGLQLRLRPGDAVESESESSPG